MSVQPIRVLALMEASRVGGPSKNLIQVGVIGARAEPGRQLQLSIATYQRTEAPSQFAVAAREAGLTVHLLQEKGRFDRGAFRQLAQLIGELRPDIIQTHNIKSHLFVHWLGQRRGAPWIAFQHGYTAVDWKDRLYSQIDRWTLPAADLVVALSEAFGRQLAAKGVSPGRIRVRHNSVRPFVAPDPDVVRRLRAQWKLGDALVVLAVGRLSQEKGHADLLRAVASVPARPLGADWKVVIAGEGPEQAALEQLRQELGLTERVIFAGHQTSVAPYYAVASVLALPSHTEGSPNVVLEAMAAGLPIVACAAGGVPEILTHEETGLLTPVADPGAFAMQLERVLRDEALRLRLGEAAKRHAVNYSPEHQYRAWYALYEELLRR